ncbi:MAG: DUF4843 domain-containing protein [Marinifilaceae bacterium]
MNTKYYILKVIFSTFAFYSTLSCSQEEISLYEQNAGIYFTQDSTSYSFTQNPKEKSVEIRIPMRISGDSVNYNRTVPITVTTDSLTTALPSMYSVGEAVIEAGKFQGYLPITFHYDERMDKEFFDVTFAISASDEFPVLQLGRNRSVVTITNLVICPMNWNAVLRTYFGPYSTSWWKFIMDKTGLSELPYWPNATDKDKWNMTYSEILIYQSFVRLELERYNKNNPDKPLRHDDGDYKDQLVTMP